MQSHFGKSEKLKAKITFDFEGRKCAEDLQCVEANVLLTRVTNLFTCDQVGLQSSGNKVVRLLFKQPFQS